jgi:hypothetical protein
MQQQAADALTRLGSSYKQPPPGVFVQDLIKLYIQLDEDNPTPTSRTLLDGSGLAPTLGTDLDTPPRPTC